MSKRSFLAVVGVTAAAGLLAAAPATAAGNVLTYGGAGGSAVAVGDVLSASLASGSTAKITTEQDGSSGITCSASDFVATATTNPAAPGTATESATSHTLTSCTTNITGATGVQSITVDNLPYTTSVSSAGSLTVTPGSAGPIQTTVKINTILGLNTCVYTADSLTAAASNTDNSLAFSNQQFTKASGPITCPGSGFFTAEYGPVQDTSQAGGPAVFVN